VALRLAELPEHRRTFAEQRIERVLTRLYGEKEERIEVVVNATLDAIEYDDYFAVTEAVNLAQAADVATFASALRCASAYIFFSRRFSSSSSFIRATIETSLRPNFDRHL